MPADRTARFSLITILYTGTATTPSLLRVNSTTLNPVYTWTPGASPFPIALEWELVLNPGDTLVCQSALLATNWVAGFGSLLLGAPS